MKSILMVCLGNICRSPLAEGILRQKFSEAGINTIKVDSAGTSSYHAGEHPDARSVQNAKSHGVDISNLRARQFTAADFDSFDQIYVMDSSNYQNVISLARDKSDEEKVELLLNKKWPGKNKAVPDPYYEGPDGFETVYRLVEQACDEIVREVIGSK
jgi:protein-tyrosine phosphatase